MAQAGLAERQIFVRSNDIVKIQTPVFETDVERFIWIAVECRRRRTLGPYAKDTICRNLGARAFGLTVDELLAHDDLYTEIRQRVATFAKLYSRCTWERLAWLFNRDPSTLAHSVKLHAKEIRPLVAALFAQESN